MSYNELIKNFDRVREYIRQFYIYGYKSRNEYDGKSARSYDNERRRIESYLGEYMFFRNDEDGKRVFLSLDSRAVFQNPIYRAFKAKSFTSGDITFHFYILDLLADSIPRTASGILAAFSEKYCSKFSAPFELDESTIRKKLKEYVSWGLLKTEKKGKEILYTRNDTDININKWQNATEFFSGENPLGVIGSFILDKTENQSNLFCFKHRYILHAIESDIICKAAVAVKEKRNIELTVNTSRSNTEKTHCVFPVKIFISTQTGRQYILAYHLKFPKPVFFRADTIASLKVGVVNPDSEKYSRYYEKLSENLWGVSLGIDWNLDHIEMTVRVEDGEGFIVNRLYREKRCGKVTQLSENSYLYSADVHDASEMLPWLRTFTGRVENLSCSNKFVEEIFYDDLAEMEKLYGGEQNAVQ